MGIDEAFYNSTFKDSVSVCNLKSVINQMDKPHYQALSINTANISDIVGIDKTLYRQELQDNLMKYEEEKEKMPITVKWLCYNHSPKFENLGGSISMGLNINGETNPNYHDNSKAFGRLKSLSVYAKYIFGNVTGDNVLGVYDKIFYQLPNVREVKTYTMVYVTSFNSLREVTLHDFGSHGNILTALELKLSPLVGNEIGKSESFGN